MEATTIRRYPNDYNPNKQGPAPAPRRTNKKKNPTEDAQQGQALQACAPWEGTQTRARQEVFQNCSLRTEAGAPGGKWGVTKSTRTTDGNVVPLEHEEVGRTEFLADRKPRTGTPNNGPPDSGNEVPAATSGGWMINMVKGRVLIFGLADPLGTGP